MVQINILACPIQTLAYLYFFIIVIQTRWPIIFIFNLIITQTRVILPPILKLEMGSQNQVLTFIWFQKHLLLSLKKVNDGTSSILKRASYYFLSFFV